MKKQIHGGDVYRHKNVVDFSSNMNPLGTPESVIRAAAESLTSMGNYPDIRCEALTAKLAEHEGVSPEMLHIGNGAAEVIFTLALALKPKRAMVLAPTFAEYEQALATVGCGMEYYYLKEEKGFYLEEGILEALNRKPELLVLCNPNNPTGILIDPDLMERILDKCAEQHIFLVVDECFQDFIPDRQAYTLKRFLKQYDNLFLLKAFTKKYAMAGIRLGYGITANQKLLERMQECVQPWNVSIPAQAAGEAALAEKDYVEQARKIVLTERAFLKENLTDLGFRVYDSTANYVFFKGPAGLCDKTLEHGIMLRDCSNYAGLLAGYYRAAVRIHEDNRKLIEVLRDIMSRT